MNSANRESRPSSEEQDRSDFSLKRLAEEIVELTGHPTSPGTYPVETEVDEATKIVLAYRVDAHPSESEVIVSWLKIGSKGMQRKTYRWSLVFPETQDRQLYQEINPESEQIRSERKGFTQADKGTINFNVATMVAKSRNG